MGGALDVRTTLRERSFPQEREAAPVARSSAPGDRGLPLPADDHRLGRAVTARAGRSLDVHGHSAGAIGAGHDLVGAACRLRRVTDDPEARAGCLRARRAWRTSRPGRTLRALGPRGPLVALVTLVSLGAARKGDEHCDGDAGDKDARCVPPSSPNVPPWQTGMTRPGGNRRACAGAHAIRRASS
jgi:hypothetical protein